MKFDWIFFQAFKSKRVENIHPIFIAVLINNITKIEYLDRDHAGSVRLMSLRYRRFPPETAFREHTVQAYTAPPLTSPPLPRCQPSAQPPPPPDPCIRRLPAQQCIVRVRRPWFRVTRCAARARLWSCQNHNIFLQFKKCSEK